MFVSIAMRFSPCFQCYPEETDIPLKEALSKSPRGNGTIRLVDGCDLETQSVQCTGFADGFFCFLKKSGDYFLLKGEEFEILDWFEAPCRCNAQ